MMGLTIGMTSILAVSGVVLWVRWATRWGSTPAERSRSMPGDDYLDDAWGTRVIMTRAVTIAASPDRVWPWLAQLGRGAGWYSVDRLDNGGKTSARHVVSWIPAPQRGDATAIGYLRDIDPGCSLAWWVDETRFAGSTARLVTSYLLEPCEGGARLVSRMTADATGRMQHVALGVFRAIDSVMAIRQLINLRSRIELTELDLHELRDVETGSKSQYQLYEALYAGGDRAGVPGREHADTWRRHAIRDGALNAEDRLCSPRRSPLREGTG